MRKILLVITLLLFVMATYIQAQKPRPVTKTNPTKSTVAKPVTKQMATTDEGKLVELSSDGTWQYADVSTDTSTKTPTVTKPEPQKNGVLSLEAGLVFKSGDIKPVARTTFYLLDKSLAEILRESGVQPQRGQDNSDRSVIFSYGLASKYGGDSSFPSGVQEAVQKHVIQSTTSDFGGKAKFSPVPQGTYYLYAVASTPKGFVIWNVKVDINSSETSATLDQNNAEFAL